jgi:hypothetical protein
LIPRLALPHNENVPSLRFESVAHSAIAHAIAGELRFPILLSAMRLLLAEATIMLVPKAAVNEDQFLASDEN